MTWTKLDDAFWSNPKVQEVGNEAAGAYARMLSYCGDHLTDGKVTEQAALFITRQKVLRVLEQHNFIERNGKGWVIPDYLDFNPSREEEKAKKKARSHAGRRGAAKTNG